MARASRHVGDLEAVARVAPRDVARAVVVPRRAHHAVRVGVHREVARRGAHGLEREAARVDDVVVAPRRRRPEPLVRPDLALAPHGDVAARLLDRVHVDRVVPVRQAHAAVDRLERLLEPGAQREVHREEAVPVVRVVAVRVARAVVVHARERVDALELVAVQLLAVVAVHLEDDLDRVEVRVAVLVAQRAQLAPHVLNPHKVLRDVLRAPRALAHGLEPELVPARAVEGVAQLRADADEAVLEEPLERVLRARAARRRVVVAAHERAGRAQPRLAVRLRELVPPEPRVLLAHRPLRRLGVIVVHFEADRDLLRRHRRVVRRAVSVRQRARAPRPRARAPRPAPRARAPPRRSRPRGPPWRAGARRPARAAAAGGGARAADVHLVHRRQQADLLV